MSSLERRKRILEYVNRQNEVRTEELSQHFDVSIGTLRNDIIKMEKEGLLVRTHGGAKVLSNMNQAFSFQSRYFAHGEEKEAIAKGALHLIQDNQCLILDASTTVLTLAKAIEDVNQLIIVTNGINTAMAFDDKPNVRQVLIGGMVAKGTASLEGLLGRDILSDISADIAFVSARGFSLKDGLTDFNILGCELKKEMLKCAKKKIALLDHSKLETRSVSGFASADEVDLIITDNKADPKVLQKYRNAGIEVKVC
jgi:DeoR/GlpR family transcriptional regulator of sugar metabolism